MESIIIRKSVIILLAAGASTRFKKESKNTKVDKNVNEDVSSPVRRSSRTRKSTEGDENYTQADANAEASSVSGISENENGSERSSRSRTSKAAAITSVSTSSSKKNNNTKTTSPTKTNAKTKAGPKKKVKKEGAITIRSRRARNVFKSQTEAEETEEEETTSDGEFNSSRRTARINSHLKSTLTRSQVPHEISTSNTRNSTSSLSSRAVIPPLVPVQALAPITVDANVDNATDTEEQVADLEATDSEMLRVMLSEFARDEQEKEEGGDEEDEEEEGEDEEEEERDEEFEEE